MATTTPAPGAAGNPLDKLVYLAKSGVGVPLVLLLLLAMIIVPLPPFLLDIFFTFNITLSLAIILAAVYVMRPLEFSIFPTILLLATLLRLALNVASTRVVLLEGHTGTGAAGKVIEAFGDFVIGGNYAVGMVVFAIIIIINFVVVTKGAGRISEVTARFTLDAMPGKQMAIDADLNAGLMTHDQAKIRREEIAMEADFYGSMDGASKFVRGDAIAGILILFINIIGGLVIGMVQHDLSLDQAMTFYVSLTIGDGLVAQIPSLILSTAVAIIVTRMSKSSDMSEQVVAQLFESPKVIGMSGVIMGFIGLIPGMPNFAFLLLAAVCIYVSWRLSKKEKPATDEAAEAATPAEQAAAEAAEAAAAPKELGWKDVTQLDPVGLEVGYRLISLVDKNQKGELIDRIKGVRKKLSRELGFLVHSVHIRDNLELSPNNYVIRLMGDVVGEGEIHPDKELAINPGEVHGELKGLHTTDPAFDMPAVWIEVSQREQAQSLGYTVVDASTVVATHISHVLKMNAHELFGHEEAQKLLDVLAESDAKLVENLVPQLLPLGVVVKVLQNLLREQIPIRNIRTIAECLAEHALQTRDIDELVGFVRVSLGRMIVQEINGMNPEVPVVTLDPNLEQMLQEILRAGPDSPGIEPGLAQRLQSSLAEFTQSQDMTGQPAILLVADIVRPWLTRFLRQSLPNLNVLSYNEIPESKRIRLISTISSD
ncbi:MAG: flagellar biosynthesis protein FlhA [Pseudomonadales bacterium]|nr:flagellar biosynthesis protein FlhA [Pseudomonadales bacterium]